MVKDAFMIKTGMITAMAIKMTSKMTIVMAIEMLIEMEAIRTIENKN